jgi:hypothetical protein
MRVSRFRCCAGVQLSGAVVENRIAMSCAHITKRATGAQARAGRQGNVQLAQMASTPMPHHLA